MPVSPPPALAPAPDPTFSTDPMTAPPPPPKAVVTATVFICVVGGFVSICVVGGFVSICVVGAFVSICVVGAFVSNCVVGAFVCVVAAEVADVAPIVGVMEDELPEYGLPGQLGLVGLQGILDLELSKGLELVLELSN